MKFLTTTNTSWQRHLNLLSQINFPFFCCLSFFEEYLNHQVRQDQANGAETVDRAYFRKARHARDMNRIGHILVYLDDETPRFGV